MKTSCCILLLLIACATPGFASVAVGSPANGATVGSPIHYVATSTSDTCSKGVASTGIYVNNQLTYVVNSASANYFS